MRTIWTVTKDSYDDRIVYGATTSREKAEQLAAAYNATVDEQFVLYEDDDPIPEYITLYTHEISGSPHGATGATSTRNVLLSDYSPDEEAHRPQNSSWANYAKAANYRTAEEAVAAAKATLNLIREMTRMS